jgi:hypothetical protein
MSRSVWCAPRIVLAVDLAGPAKEEATSRIEPSPLSARRRRARERRRARMETIIP